MKKDNTGEIALMLLDKYEQVLLDSMIMRMLLKERGIHNIDAYIENSRSTSQLLDSVRSKTAGLRAHILSQAELETKVLEALKSLPENGSKIVH